KPRHRFPAVLGGCILMAPPVHLRADADRYNDFMAGQRYWAGGDALRSKYARTRSRYCPGMSSRASDCMARSCDAGQPSLRHGAAGATSVNESDIAVERALSPPADAASPARPTPAAASPESPAAPPGDIRIESASDESSVRPWPPPEPSGSAT